NFREEIDSAAQSGLEDDRVGDGNAVGIDNGLTKRACAVVLEIDDDEGLRNERVEKADRAGKDEIAIDVSDLAALHIDAIGAVVRPIPGAAGRSDVISCGAGRAVGGVVDAVEYGRGIESAGAADANGIVVADDGVDGDPVIVAVGDGEAVAG